MTVSRFEIRPIASRRLRAALLLVFLLGLLGLSQTRLNGLELLVAFLVLSAIFADGLRRTQVPACTLVFENRPLVCRLSDSGGGETLLRATRASVYPWLIILKFEAVQGEAQIGHETGVAQRWLKYPIVLLPDSLAHQSAKDGWRHLLVWSQQLRSTLANA